MDTHIDPHVEFNVTTGKHDNMLKTLSTSLSQPSGYYYRANHGIKQVVIRLRSTYAHPNGLRLYMQPDNQYITGFSSGTIFEFSGHNEHNNSIKQPYNSSYVTIPGASLGRKYLENAVELLTEMANAAEPPLWDIQKYIFVIVHHIAEALRLKTVSNIIARANKKRKSILINDLIIRQINGWSTLTKGIGEYTKRVYVTKEEKALVHGRGG